MSLYYQRLFDHMAQEHGLILTESEMVDIIEVCKTYLQPDDKPKDDSDSIKAV